MHSEPTDTAKEILVVDDDEAFAHSLVDVLRSEGFQVTVAENGKRALQILALRGDQRPSLVLLDLDMPIMDGASFLDAYTATRSFPLAPVVVLSGTLAGHSRREGAVIVYLKKPVDLALLIETVRLWAV
jgi:CheY-like chemotaxis protein